MYRTMFAKQPNDSSPSGLVKRTEMFSSDRGRRESCTDPRILSGFEYRVYVPSAVKYAHNLNAFGARSIEDYVLANDKASQPVAKFRPGSPHARLFR